MVKDWSIWDFKVKMEHIENQQTRETVTPLPMNAEDSIRDKTAKYEQCTTSYQTIFTNLTFLRLFVMILLASFAVFSILYLMPPLAQERGASDVTASLTVTICGATGTGFQVQRLEKIFRFKF